MIPADITSSIQKQDFRKRLTTDRGENRRHTIMMLGGEQHGGLSEESISSNMPQQVEILQRLTNIINQQLMDLPALSKVILQEVCHAIDSVHFCLIALHNPQTKQLELTATSRRYAEKLVFQELTNTESGLLNRVFATGVSQLFQTQESRVFPLLTPDTRHMLQPGESRTSSGSLTETPDTSSCSERFVRSNGSRRTNARQWIPCFPSSIYAVAIESAQAGRLGVIAIGNWENVHAFNIADQNLLDAVGEVSAIAINNSRMIKALEEREECLARQNEILVQQNHELEKNRHQIQLQNLQLLEAAQLKSQFLGTTSHELRTPLNVILGLSQVLLRQRTSSLSEKQTDMVQRILNNGNNLLAIIEDILCFANIETGSLSFQAEEFNLTTLVLLTVAEHSAIAEEKGLNLQVQLNLDNSLVVNDSIRLKEVLVKLLLNAIKFTETGSVQVTVSEIANDRIAIAVKDTGIGIAESELENIFEQFWQVDQTTTRCYGGTGLGLAIIKSLVEIMQGKISVTSKLGQGSTFCIELPRKVNSQ